MSSPALLSHSTPTSAETLLRIRHTCAHVLAMAVQTLFPETKVTIGPWTDTGFYYDFDRQTPFTPDDLIQIATEMRRIINANLPIVREVVDREQIRAKIEQLHEPYKLEILDSIPADEPITRYFIGFVDTLQNVAEASLFHIAADGSRQRPIMIHRAIFGSLERFFGILIENYAGDFPLWLAPVQVRLLPVSDEQRDYATAIAQQLKQLGYRVEVDSSGERLGKQIRTAEVEKIPVVAVIWSLD